MSRRRSTAGVDFSRGIRITRPAISRRAAVPRHIRAFKGGEASRIYADWFATLASPDDDIRGDIRRLRGRARQLDRDNPYVGAYKEGVITNVLGHEGFDMRPQVRNDSGELMTDLNDQIRDAWYEWASGSVTTDGQLSLHEFEEILLGATAIEGEQFPRTLLGDDLAHGLGLAAIDPDLVDDGYNVMGAGGSVEVRMGVEMDARGRRLAYYVTEDPSYAPTAGARRLQRMAAEGIIHLFRPRRMNQTRGVTWITRIMAHLHTLATYTENELVASAAGAAKAGFFQWKEPALGPGLPAEKPESETDPLDGGSASVPMDVEPGTYHELPRGMEFVAHDPQHPTTAFADFMKAILRGTASGLLVNYHTLTGDLESTSYSSMRAGLIAERDMWKRLQMWFVRSWRIPLYHRWLQTAILTGRLDLPGNDWRRYREVMAKPRGFAWVDPQKDAAAAETLLRLRLTSPQRVVAERGDDLEEILEDWKRAQEMAQKNGVSLEAMFGAAPAPAADDSVDDAPPAPDDAAPPSRNGRARARFATRS